MKTPANTTKETIYSGLRKANDCFADLDNFAPAVRLFDEFWREGELALMFGASGMGKSLLAVQIADAIARGARVEGFRMEASRRKVLLVDLVHGEAQFRRRYAFYPPESVKAKYYKFAERLWRARPRPSEELVTWIRKRVREEGIQAVIIDDLSAMKTTCDGTRETLKLMRDLRKLCNELGISILAIAGAEAGPGRIVNEGDLKRNRVLCDVADSVFGIGRHPSNRDTCIVQTRCRNAPVFWTERNAPICRVVRLDSGLLGMMFDERFRPVLSEEEVALIRRVKTLKMRGMPYRAIADELGITKSRASRLMSKWTEEIGVEEEPQSVSEPSAVAGGPVDEKVREWEGEKVNESVTTEHTKSTEQDELEEWDECDLEKPVWLDEFATDRSELVVVADRPEIGMLHESRSTTSSAEAAATPPIQGGEFLGPHACPFLYDASPDAERWFLHLVRTHPKRTDESILRDYTAAEPWCRPPGAAPPYAPNDPFSRMEATTDDHGNKIFVEERDERGKPRIWYWYRSDGCLIRFISDGNGRSGTPANPNLFGRFARSRKPLDKRGVFHFQTAA